jgi:hypothetical protein
VSLPLIFIVACAVLSVVNCVGAIYCAETERYLASSLLLANFFVFGLLIKSDLFG